MAHFVVVLLRSARNINQNSTRTNENVGGINNRQMAGNWSGIIGTQLGDINARGREREHFAMADRQ